MVIFFLHNDQKSAGAVSDPVDSIDNVVIILCPAVCQALGFSVISDVLSLSVRTYRK